MTYYYCQRIMTEYLDYDMKHITEVLRDNGYVEVLLNGKSGSPQKYVKDNDFENPIMWGLNELHKPPTLTYPRPNIRVIRQNGEFHLTILRQNFDDAMNLCLQRENHQDIYNALFDRTIEFNYNMTGNPQLDLINNDKKE